LYIVGQVLILLGAAIELFMMRSLETLELSPIHAPSVLTPEGGSDGPGLFQPTLPTR
jgi:hypothetical protein